MTLCGLGQITSLDSSFLRALVQRFHVGAMLRVVVLVLTLLLKKTQRCKVELVSHRDNFEAKHIYFLKVNYLQTLVLY